MTSFCPQYVPKKEEVSVYTNCSDGRYNVTCSRSHPPLEWQPAPDPELSGQSSFEESSQPRSLKFLTPFLFEKSLTYFWLHWIFVAAQGLLTSCRRRTARCAGFSCCGAEPLGAWASVVSTRMGSVVAAQRLSHSVAHGIFLDQGSNSCPLHWQADSYPLYHQGSPSLCFFKMPVYFLETLQRSWALIEKDQNYPMSDLSHVCINSPLCCDDERRFSLCVVDTVRALPRSPSALSLCTLPLSFSVLLKQPGLLGTIPGTRATLPAYLESWSIFRPGVALSQWLMGVIYESPVLPPLFGMTLRHNALQRSQQDQDTAIMYRSFPETVFYLILPFPDSPGSITLTNCGCSCSVAKSWPIFYPMHCSLPGFSVLHYLPELPKFLSIESVMPSNHLILCHPLLFLPLIFPSIRVFSSESAVYIRWPNCWSLSVSISSSNEYSGLISFRIDCSDILTVQGTLKSLLQKHSSKASVLQCSAFFITNTQCSSQGLLLGNPTQDTS